MQHESIYCIHGTPHARPISPIDIFIHKQPSSRSSIPVPVLILPFIYLSRSHFNLIVVVESYINSIPIHHFPSITLPILLTIYSCRRSPIDRTRSESLIPLFSLYPWLIYTNYKGNSTRLETGCSESIYAKQRPYVHLYVLSHTSPTTLPQ